MKAMESDWYKKIWTLDIRDQSWVEDTKRQVDFLIEKLELKGNERILDLACGFGRHSLELARRGYDVTGVDITPEYIEYATKQAQRENLSARFLCSDIRDVGFNREFDVVLNMADGAIGYLENEEENLKIFRVISKALKPGGKHFMDIMNRDYAETHFPCKLWDAGEKGLTLSNFEWDKKTKTLIYGQIDYTYGKPLFKPEMTEGNPIRLYSTDEIKNIFEELGMSVYGSFADVSGIPSSANSIQCMICSGKNYNFWGWEHADAPAISNEYKKIKTPIDLYNALSEIWCAETCAPRMRNQWTGENKTLGQCSITAFLAQDIFGGKVYGILRPGGNYHCYNVIGDCKFDLTSEQFGDEVLDYENNPEQFREVHFAKEEKRLRYEYLRKELYERYGNSVE
ncbi:MAG: SAM-dependent methyltransferase [Lachnospiraceae bacterium]